MQFLGIEWELSPMSIFRFFLVLIIFFGGFYALSTNPQEIGKVLAIPIILFFGSMLMKNEKDKEVKLSI